MKTDEWNRLSQNHTWRISDQADFLCTRLAASTRDVGTRGLRREEAEVCVARNLNPELGDEGRPGWSSSGRGPRGRSETRGSERRGSASCPASSRGGRRSRTSQAAGRSLKPEVPAEEVADVRVLAQVDSRRGMRGRWRASGPSTSCRRPVSPRGGSPVGVAARGGAAGC